MQQLDLVGNLCGKRVIWQPATNSFWQLATNSEILSISATIGKKCGNIYPVEIPQYVPISEGKGECGPYVSVSTLMHRKPQNSDLSSDHVWIEQTDR